MATYPRGVWFGRFFQQESTAPGSVTVTGYTPGAYQWVDNSLYGQSPADWKIRIANGLNATSTGSGLRTHISVGTLDAHKITKVGPINGIDYRNDSRMWGSWNPWGIPPVSPTDLSYDAAETQARLKWLGRLRDARTAFQGGTFFGEIAETLRMLRNPAQAFRRGITDYYRTVTKRARRVKGTRRKNAVVRETYLEYTFGWAPLMNDISDIVDLARRKTRDYRQVISAQADVPFFKVPAFAQIGADFGMPVDIYGTFTGSASVRYKGAVKMDMPEPSFFEFTGLGVSNFLPTVWNLIPYSFLVDYFSNIGKVIDAASLGTVSLSWGCRTIRRKVSITTDRVEIHAAGGEEFYLKSASLSGCSSERVLWERTGITDISAGISDIQLRIPGVSSPWKWLNIAALASMRSVRS